MKKVLIIGDAILDVYRECTFKKQCPDALNVQAVVYDRVENRPGGAANVAVNLRALAPDVKVDLITVMDRRLESAILSKARGINLKFSVVANDHILVKERIIVDGRFVLRVDNASKVSDADATELLDVLSYYLTQNDPDLIVLSDYGGGSVNKESLEMLFAYRDRLLVDTKITDLSSFAANGRRSLLLKLNESEWKAALQLHHSPEEFFSFMVVTHGENGAELITRQKISQSSIRQSISVSGHNVPVVDVCGCGDTFLAGMAGAMVMGHDSHTAMQFANAAAATVVSKFRTEIGDRDAALALIGRTTI